ncbi:MAG TPA: sugar phosphate nucleotidyltransferase, partial [Caldilineaceae bacterium]|nr:sugar phosphate nucleotidyltransferase [Caldilineaceae bacterium]
DRSRGGVRLLHPYVGRNGQQWYAGTADAIAQNMNFIEENRADAVVILSGDHIYKMDYRHMIDFHHERGADLTIAVMPVPMEETHRYGIMQVDDNQNIIQFYEKPKERDKGNLASMGIYIFSTHMLTKRLAEHSNETPRTDFGQHVIPAMLSAGDKVVAYKFEGYWVDVGTIDSYWSTNLALLQPEPALDLYGDQWPIHTKSEERPAAKVGSQAKVVNSMLSNGCIVRGMVTNSILSPGVYVSPGAVVKDSVVMNDTWIGPGALLDKVVIDKQVVIGAGAVVGTGDESVANEQMPDKLFAGISVIGKNAYIPDRAEIGRNVLINSGCEESSYPADRIVGDGKTI